MQSPFAMYAPKGLTFEKPKETYKFQKYAEFTLYKLPTMLDKHSSSKLCDNDKMVKNNRKHKRNNSIVIETAGILMNACKTVSFSSNVEIKTYKKDT
jgi:hypothetical protein